jgi:hypothetical protein
MFMVHYLLISGSMIKKEKERDHVNQPGHVSEE